MQRLSSEQTQELVAFLYRVRPEVERGRFGFAQWLSRHGPRFIQALAHGVLVELVQLLLNNRVLQFRKGRVSVTAPHTSGHPVASSLPSLSVSGSNPSRSNLARAADTVGDGRVSAVARASLITVPSLSTPSDRAFIPASVLPFTAPFNAVDLLFSLCSLRRSIAPSICHQYPCHLPLYHYEQTATRTSSSTVWVSVCTVVLRCESTTAHSVTRQFKSTQHESKDAARQESARRALQDALWYLCFDRCLLELRQLDNRQREGESRQQRQHIMDEERQRTECEERLQHQTADSVTQLDRYLAFLHQPTIVYTLLSHVMQNSAGARTLWQARGQVLLDGQLLPNDRVRVRAWSGCELVLSSTPSVSYAAQARKTQAKALVSQQLISKITTLTASLVAQPTPHTRTIIHELPVSIAPATRSTPQSTSQPSTYADAPSTTRIRSFPVEGSTESWRPSATQSKRSTVPLTSNNLFAFPSYTDLQLQPSSMQGEYEYEDEFKEEVERAEGEEFI